MGLRILILGNMANDGYSVAKEMRRMDMDVDLAVNVSDFGMALPEWEEANLQDVDPYDFSPKKVLSQWTPPSWIVYIDMLNRVPLQAKPLSKLMARVNLMKLIRGYDVVEAQVPFSIYAQFSDVPYCPYDAGAIRYFPFKTDFRSSLFRRSYANARMIIFTNPDTLRIFDKLEYARGEKLKFIPFSIDPEKYRPLDAHSLRAKLLGNDSGMLMFSPSRQIWKEKGNEKIIIAFSKFLKHSTRSKLVLVDWSVDNLRSQELVNRLGIQRSVVWIRPVPKNQLLWYYNAADIVLDQFILGSWGTSSPEAMSCAKPVLLYYNPVYIKRCFGDTPPIPNSFTVDDIYINLRRLSEDDGLRKKVGQESRDWVMKTHHPRIVAQRHYDILMSVASS